jgi:hypothetical protein
MPFTVLAHLFSVFFDTLCFFGRSNQEKDLEILLLRWQVRMLQRKHTPICAEIEYRALGARRSSSLLGRVSGVLATGVR